MEFEWGDDKALSNLAKHGVSFEIAWAFDWDRAMFFPDRRFDYGEPRVLAIGPDSDGEFYSIVFTPRGAKTRIISARRANKREVDKWRAPKP